MKIDGLPAAATSPTVLAPERHTSRSGARENCGHVVDERRDFRVQAGSLVSGLGVTIVAFAGLVDDVKAGNLFAQRGQGVDDRPVDGVRSLAAAEDQQRGRLVGGAARRDLEERGADRDAGDFIFAEVAARLVELDGGGGDQGRDQAIGEAGDYVGLEGDGRNARRTAAAMAGPEA